MYRVLGADGKEYGPVTGAVLRQWITQGRAHAQTRVLAEGSAEWQTLASAPEFEALFPPEAGATVLVEAPEEVRTSDMAIGSLVLGVVGLCGITALGGLILGIVSLVTIKRSGGRLRGQGLAAAGICVSSVMLLLSIPFMAGLTLPAIARARHRAALFSLSTARQQAEIIHCSGNLKILALGVKLYAQNHANQLPPAAAWCDAIQGDIGSPGTFQCVTEPSRRCAYAFNAKLAGKKDNEIDPVTVMLFESDLGWNGGAGPGALKPHKHSSQYVNVALADGSVKAVPRSQLKTLRWDP
jgi:prepilin-type processing-associated H-X9-DG protein